MASQVINTNIASLTAQRNLSISSDGYATCLERLSSGLRINSAKDDAAGLAIATRMEATISGSIVAKRNCNDAVSLSQIAEGALQETSNMLVRIRELAVQSANGTNASQDRHSLNAEVNQLLAQLSMSSSQTTFNGLKLLDGTLAAASFQVGPEEYQSVTISIDNTNPNQIGVNYLTPNQADGMQQANYGTLIEEDVVALSNAATNGLAVTTFNFVEQTNVAATTVALPAVTTVLNDTASKTAKALNTALGTGAGNYVQASAYTDVFISNLTYDNGHTFTIAGKDDNNAAIVGFTIPVATPNVNYDYIAEQINNSNTLSAAGIYAISQANGVRVISNKGHDLTFTAPANSTTTYNINQYNAAGNSVANANSAAPGDYTAHGLLTVEMSQNVTLANNKDTNAAFYSGNEAVVRSGLINTTTNNRLQTQTITLAGNDGNVDINVVANSSAAAVAAAINNKTGATGISATATTSLNIQNITHTGTVKFDLYGDNTQAVTISASVTTADYSNLVTNINDYTGTTGITAKFDDSQTVITLSNSNGNDIRIANFAHSAGVVPQDVTTTKLGLVTGSNLNVPTISSMDIIGNPTDNPSGSVVTLYAGGSRNQYDTTVIGGTVKFTSDTSFSVSTNIDGTVYKGSLFNLAALSSNASTFSAISMIDISTAAGAAKALPVLDQAIDQISGIRAKLGAIQARFESAIRNLAYSIDNIAAAKSRVMDTDFAEETSNLSRTQILTQAGLSMVSQANAIPHNIISLLQ